MTLDNTKSDASNTINLEHQFDSFTKKIKEDLFTCIDAHFGECKKQFNALVARINHMDCEIAKLNEKIDNLEIAQRSCDVTVSNIPSNNSEIVPDIVKRIGNAINFNCDKHYFSAFRIRAKNSSLNSAPPIVVKFALKASAIEFFNLYKTKGKLSLNDIGMNSAARIYINRGLTAKSNQLFIEARKLQGTGKLFKTFIKSGMVYFQQTQTSEPTRLFNVQQLAIIIGKGPIIHPSAHKSSCHDAPNLPAPIDEASPRKTRSKAVPK